ncbi:hypothetical protein [Catenibacillus scindens]|uniref:hypothetical protein n=1 Tax=Catenibacillus scindens TaxID=673271 RepID=UPI00320A012C
MRTMYLLHGAYGNYMDWLIHTRIYELAQRAGTAVIMPSRKSAAENVWGLWPGGH